jgi:hypothetical protein
MLECFNNIYIIIISILLLYAIIKKIINLNKPFNEVDFLTKYNNQQKLKENLSLDNLKKQIPTLTSYYIGLN